MGSSATTVFDNLSLLRSSSQRESMSTRKKHVSSLSGILQAEHRLMIIVVVQGTQLMRSAAQGDSALLLGGDLIVIVHQAEQLCGQERLTHPFARVSVSQVFYRLFMPMRVRMLCPFQAPVQHVTVSNGTTTADELLIPTLHA